jgi:thioredoxin-like negative regulator of GroEL
MLTPVLESVLVGFSDITLNPIDIDVDQERTEAFKVRGVPTLVLLKDGVEISSLVGNHPKSKIEEWLTENTSEVEESSGT